MRLTFRIRKSPAFSAGLFLLALVFVFSSIILLQPDRERPREANLPPPQITRFVFGMGDQVADFLWLRALQDFDYCEKEIAKQACISSGWLFRMLDLITDLAPQFRMPYATGGLALTVLVNDFKGASALFEKAVVAFPEDWPILSRAAYHVLYEEKDKMKAAQLLKRAAEQGAPPWYYMLANRLSLEEGDYEFSKALILQLENESNPDPLLLQSLRKRVDEARKQKND
ncbi:MAG TPA: hypothetical protein PL182_08355 [Pseudobdellovibrionaceae bacterium]|nr:hypothetical protein [Pseudobdellovibrionaceae bacterium]